MKKYIFSLTVSLTFAFALSWALSFTTFTEYVQGVLVGIFLLFIYTLCTSVLCAIEEEDDEDRDIGGEAMPYPQH